MSDSQLDVFTFRTPLGWMGVAGSGDVVWQITFGHESERQAYEALPRTLVNDARHRNWCPKLVARLKKFASGENVDFRDVKLQLDHLGTFQREVVKHCRAIAYGRTRSYGELAEAAGSPGAARAVGTTMAKNRFPLVVPCHRVLASGGKIGGYSAKDGLDMKRRLLALEARGGSVKLPQRAGSAEQRSKAQRRSTARRATRGLA